MANEKEIVDILIDTLGCTNIVNLEFWASHSLIEKFNNVDENIYHAIELVDWNLYEFIKELKNSIYKSSGQILETECGEFRIRRIFELCSKLEIAMILQSNGFAKSPGNSAPVPPLYGEAVAGEEAVKHVESKNIISSLCSEVDSLRKEFSEIKEESKNKKNISNNLDIANGSESGNEQSS